VHLETHLSKVFIKLDQGTPNYSFSMFKEMLLATAQVVLLLSQTIWINFNGTLSLSLRFT